MLGPPCSYFATGLICFHFWAIGVPVSMTIQYAPQSHNSRLYRNSSRLLLLYRPLKVRSLLSYRKSYTIYMTLIYKRSRMSVWPIDRPAAYSLSLWAIGCYLLFFQKMKALMFEVS